ncbi:TatD family hydrolase [Candidatus Dependentiae bacterium]|nr:TatD family hydrolase [Candidatus Dependentiae bacterium]
MLIDTHCHINMIVKKEFDIPISQDNFLQAKKIISQANESGVKHIINVGTSLIESKNCVALARDNASVYATVGIHPNDCTPEWKKDIEKIKQLIKKKEENKIVGIGEVGLDKHYPDYNLARQKDALKTQIDLALENDLALVIHTRDAYDETLRSLEEYKNDIDRGIVHCFSEDLTFAKQVIEWGFSIGIGGTVTYPKNNTLREVVEYVDLNTMVLETDAPFLPPQSMRGQTNYPSYIPIIAQYIAQLKNESLESVAHETTSNAQRIFTLPHK